MGKFLEEYALSMHHIIKLILSNLCNIRPV